MPLLRERIGCREKTGQRWYLPEANDTPLCLRSRALVPQMSCFTWLRLMLTTLLHLLPQALARFLFLKQI